METEISGLIATYLQKDGVLPMRNPEYRFLATDIANSEEFATELWKVVFGTAVHPASPGELYIKIMSAVLTYFKGYANYIGNQNIPSRAVGGNLDATAELTAIGSRPEAKPATTVMKFTISEEQEQSILIPGGTRVTDASNTLYWQTGGDVYISPGETETTLTVTCMTPGTVGNGWAKGSICKAVDIFDYYASCENTTISDGGSDVPDDAAFYDLMRWSMASFSDAGSMAGYIYWAKRASTTIKDVRPVSHTPGVVTLYVLCDNGEPAGEELKKAVLDSCTPSEVRPLTDKVEVKDPTRVEYDIDLTWYTSKTSTIAASNLQAAVEKAVEEYIAWQCGQLGRDINPSMLTWMVMQTGVKRVDVRKPTFQKLKNGEKEGEVYTVPELAKLKTKTIKAGGIEDD